jgi:acetoin utilization deacetylase AcuC-like enzyme/GNAT superfamily N-acetyltransferase
LFRIRRIYDDTLPINKQAIKQVQEILKTQFNELNQQDIEKLPKHLRNPLEYRFRSILFVADDEKGRVRGFALLHHAADLNFTYLDYIAAAQQKTGRGIGSALYEMVREMALQLGVVGIFFECLPDDPKLCQSEFLKQNIARLRFYERYGARPIWNTAYETPVKPDDNCPPYLVFDSLGRETPLLRDKAREIVRAILKRKYAYLCPPEYIEMVVASFRDDPVQLRPPKYIKKEIMPVVPLPSPKALKIALVVNDKHEIHHVHERGYVESPVRVKSILKEILPTGLFEQVTGRRYGIAHITAVHDPDFVRYLRKICSNLPPNKSVYPYVFPIRNVARPPKELPIRAGYYCIDTFTPLNQNAFLAAKRAIDCTLTAADQLLKGHYIAYALVRPPGHHAERRVFGGFCYFNSASVAAHYLSRHGKVSILDIDYHHGNGHQSIFYERADVLTISIHGQPSFSYPYFSGFSEEIGEGSGKGFNLNLPQPEKLDGSQYREALSRALRRIRQFDPQFVIVALGLDTAKGDPTGSWSLTAKDFFKNGQMIGRLGLPLLIVQEGGYAVRSLGINARHFFVGLWQGFNSFHKRGKYGTIKNEK